MKVVSHPIVMICIPTYKGAAFLEATIDSVLAQSYRDFELWIFDDQSPDQTRTLVAGYSDPRVHYVRNDINLGPEANWNRCLARSYSRYFKLLPHDDLLAPGSLQEQVDILEADTAKALALVFGYRQIINAKGRVIMKRGLPGAQYGRVRSGDLVRRCVRAGTNLIGEPGNGLFRSELIAKIGPYDAGFPYMVDADYWFRVLMHGDAFFTNSHSSSFRLSSGSWSTAIGRKQFANFRGFIEKYAEHAQFLITAADVRLGLVRARFNMVARMLTYRFLG
jgi:glycosyltransferase involved in cell wall biosynthesis